MKPKAPTEHEDGLLEYLEDIIGTSGYKARIEELNKEVEELNEERGSKLARVQVVEREKKGLEVSCVDGDDFERFSKNEIWCIFWFRARKIRQWPSYEPRTNCLSPGICTTNLP